MKLEDFSLRHLTSRFINKINAETISVWRQTRSGIKTKKFHDKKRWERNNKAILIKRHVEEALKIVFSSWNKEKIIKRTKNETKIIAFCAGLGFWRHFNYEIFIISLWHNKTTTCADSFVLLFLKSQDDSLRAICRSFSRNNCEDIKDCFEGTFCLSFGSECLLCFVERQVLRNSLPLVMLGGCENLEYPL